MTTARILDQRVEAAPEPEADALFEPPVDPLAQFEPSDAHWHQAKRAVDAWWNLFGLSLDLERTARHIAMLDCIAGLKPE